MKKKMCELNASIQFDEALRILASFDAFLSSAQLILESSDASMKVMLRKQMKDMEAQTKRKILKLHKGYSEIWQPEGRPEIFKTYLPDPLHKRGRRIVEARSLEGLEKKIYEWYRSGKSLDKSFKDCYYLWIDDEKGDAINATKKRYEDDIRRFFMSSEEEKAFFEQPIKKLTEEQIDRYIRNQIKTKQLCKEAIKHLFRLFRSTCNYAWRKRILDEDPCARLELRQYSRIAYPSPLIMRQRTLTPDEWSAIAAQMTLDQVKGLMTAFAAEFLSYTGCRPGEAAGLRWMDVDFGRKQLIIINAIKYDPVEHSFSDGLVKNRMPRFFPLTGDIEDLLRRVKAFGEEHGIISDYVFADQTGPLTTGKITSYIKNKCRQLGLSHEYCSYSIRRTTNSVSRQNGTSRQVAASLIGNSPAVNDQFYTEDVARDPEKLQAAENMSLKNWI